MTTHNERHAEVVCLWRMWRNNGLKMRQRRREASASDPNSPKVHRHESYVAEGT
jgi:hypothetical protein